jgi:hypothetical protein
MALCASSLRGRPALDAFAFGESEASAERWVRMSWLLHPSGG